MEHVVFFPAHDGSPAFRRLASLEDAVRFVEHLRNTEGVDRVSVHALTEVPLAFKAYYKVEMPESAPEAVAAPPVVAEAVPVVVPEQELPVAEEAVAAPSSMGFFAR
ncbi:MAG TPA: hypothetical protein VL281_07740 [Mycobacteriales bacterium]|jgi:hypothetical protein|nr:hypothetical protein [Mycobacteriales bacterium]